jgi:hypothetical protein
MHRASAVVAFALSGALDERTAKFRRRTKALKDVRFIVHSAALLAIPMR